MHRRRSVGHAVAATVVLSLATAPIALGDLTWDADTTTAGVQDGSGTWDLSTPHWLGVTGAGDIAWVNNNNAILGNTTSTYTEASNYTIKLASAISAANINLGVATSGAMYSLTDTAGGSLTITGNLTKSIAGGTSSLTLANNLTLSNAGHTFAVNDTSATSVGLNIASAIVGGGSVTIDNGSYAIFGTTAFTHANSYTGTTAINNGRLVITDSAALGDTSAGTTIGPSGCLALGGGGVYPTAGLTIAEPITITRNIYTGLSYPAAITNATTSPFGRVDTFSGSFTVDTPNAVIQPNGGVIVIASDIAKGPDVTTPAITLGGTGTLSLTGNNSALTGGVTLASGTLSATSENSLGGASAPLIFAGSGYFRPASGFMTGFGSHAVNYANFSGGLNIDGGKTFSIPQNLSGDFFGKTGDGSLTLSGSNSFIAINLVNGTVSLASSGALGSSGSITMSTGSALQHTAANTVDYSSRFSTVAGQVFTIDTNGQNVTWASSITSSGSTLYKYGAGVLTLSGNNAFSSAFIRSGTVRTGPGGLGSTQTVTVAGSSTNRPVLAANGSNVTIPNAVYIVDNGIITAGSGATSSDSVGRFASGINAWSNGGEYDFKIASTVGSTDGTSGAGTNWDVISASSLAIGDSNAFTIRLVNAGGVSSIPNGAKFEILNIRNGNVSPDILNNPHFFKIDATAFGLAAGSFTVTSAGGTSLGSGETGSDLFLNYSDGSTPTPELASTSLFAASCSILLLRRRRHARG